uniref:Uncharacterized protein n=1 Tax=Arundo donax TaxID=35708 RepID=A0A0A9CPG8_ARUDO
MPGSIDLFDLRVQLLLIVCDYSSYSTRKKRSCIPADHHLMLLCFNVYTTLTKRHGICFFRTIRKKSSDLIPDYMPAVRINAFSFSSSAARLSSGKCSYNLSHAFAPRSPNLATICIHVYELPPLFSVQVLVCMHLKMKGRDSGEHVFL